ncbi:hypothetical protein H4R99_000002 [Coemansia sp. RSA 1722]|nr:hypothetical protein IWW45_000117 [Coemansia sp. RSA 485]KAJ2606829.1 hypothetical protein H4R99_000002 [Coemansia sp. RSA 1722]
MDFSRPRMRYGSNTSFSSGAGGGGPQIVKTYGRFKQRMIPRDTKGAQEFARVASARPILADMFGSDSSDSDFENTETKHKLVKPPSQIKPQESTAQKTADISDNGSTAKPKARSTVSSKDKPKAKPKSKSKTKANAKTKVKAKGDSKSAVNAKMEEKANAAATAAVDDVNTISKPSSQPKSKPRSKARAKENEKESVEPLVVSSVTVETPETEMTIAPVQVLETLPNGKPPENGVYNSEPAATDEFDSENAVINGSTDLQTDTKPQNSELAALKSQQSIKDEDMVEEPRPKPKSKPRSNSKAKPKAEPKNKSKAKAKPKAKAKAKTQPDSDPKSKPEPRSRTRSNTRSKSKPGSSDEVQLDSTVNAQVSEVAGKIVEIEDADNMDIDSVAVDKTPMPAFLPTPKSNTQSQSHSPSSSMVLDNQQTIAEQPTEPEPQLTASPIYKATAETVINLPSTESESSNEASDKSQSKVIVSNDIQEQPDTDNMQVDEQETEPFAVQSSESAPVISHSIEIGVFDDESSKMDVLAFNRASNMTSAMPSPISSGRVTKRKPTRPRKPTIVRKKSIGVLEDPFLAKDADDSNRMSIDHNELPPLITDADATSGDCGPFQLLVQNNEQADVVAANIQDAALSASPMVGVKRKSPEIEMRASDLPSEPLVAEEFELDGVSDDEDAPHRQLMGTRTIRFRAPRDARVQTFELDEDDRQMEQSQSNDQTQQVSTPIKSGTAVSSSDDPFSPVHSHSISKMQSEQAKPNVIVCTPQKKNLSRLASVSVADAPHSPSRMATPHRVVYSPVNPMTVINPHRNGAQSAINNGPLKSDVPLSNALVPPKFSLGQAKDEEKDTGNNARQTRLSSIGTGIATGRMSMAGDMEPEFEETRLPFLPARRYVQKTHILGACGQTAPIDWASDGLQACGVLLPDIDTSTHTEAQMSVIESQSGLCKIGEATYSEVFSAQWRYVPRTRYDRFNSKKGMVKGERLMQVALKIIPFGNSGVKSGTGEPQTTLRDLYQEIGATLALSRLSERERAKLQEARLQHKSPLSPKERELGANFVKAFRVCICQGPLPAPLLRAWDRWKSEYPDLCENTRPDYYPQNQLFAVFVLEMGGETLENAMISTWKEARSIIRQLALSMALAERNSRFEHRDLHWGNIMVTRSNSHLTFLYQLPPSETRQRSTLLSIPSYKVRCTIIDYTLSRLHIDNDENDMVGTKPANYDASNNVFYVALKDEALFRGEGDIQYDVYRQMRKCSDGKWDGFYPKTNVLWLTYVLHKIITTKSPAIRDELTSFAQSKLGAAIAGAPEEIKRAASQELVRRWVAEFEQCESCTQVLQCALLDLYKH